MKMKTIWNVRSNRSISLAIVFAIALGLGGATASADVPKTRGGDTVKLVTGDLTPQPDGTIPPKKRDGIVQGPEASRDDLVSKGSKVRPGETLPTPGDVNGPLGRPGLMSKSDPEKPKPAPEKGPHVPGGKKTPNPIGTGPAKAGGVPQPQGGPIDPAGLGARVRNAADGGVDEEETTPILPRPLIRPKH